MPPLVPTLEEVCTLVTTDRKRKRTPLKTKGKKQVKLDDSIGLVNEKSNIIKTMSRQDLELLVQRKIIESIQVKSNCGELAKQVAKLSVDNVKLKEKAANLQKQLVDLVEVTKRIKVMEETNTVRIPKVTRSVGLQVTSKIRADFDKDTIKPAGSDIVDEGRVDNRGEGDIIILKSSNEVARKSTNTRKSVNFSDIFSENKKDEVKPLSLSVKKCSGRDDGIVVAWDKKLETFDLSAIVNYELEGTKGNMTKKSLKWSRIGEPIEPLPLPMACNLNNFKNGVFYNFRVKLVTKDNSFYSNIASITL